MENQKTRERKEYSHLPLDAELYSPVCILMNVTNDNPLSCQSIQFDAKYAQVVRDHNTCEPAV